MNRSKCKACGREIYFIKGADSGRTIPLEQVNSVYTVSLAAVGWYAYPVTSPKDSKFFISHFVSCPKANSFSKSKSTQTNQFEPQQHNEGDTHGSEEN